MAHYLAFERIIFIFRIIFTFAKETRGIQYLWAARDGQRRQLDTRPSLIVELLAGGGPWERAVPALPDSLEASTSRNLSSPTTGPSTAETKSDATQSRRLNAWIDDPSPRVGQPFHVSANIGIPDGLVDASAVFDEPEWGDTQTLALLISLSCRTCTIDPRSHLTELPRLGNSDAVIFKAIPKRPGKHHFSIKLYLPKQMILLQSLGFAVDVEAEEKSAAA